MASLSPSSRIDETNASEFSSVIDLGLFKKKRLSVFERYRALASPLPILPFPSSALIWTWWTKFQATNNQVWQLLGSSYGAPWNTYILKEVFLFTIRESCP